MRYKILGPLEVRDGARPLALARGRQRVLLAVLLLHGNEVISTERLIDALWGESPPPAAAGSLHNLTAALRRVLGEGVLRTRGGGYELRVGDGDLDARRFEALVTQGRDALAASEPERAADLLRQGLALWRGPPLADLAYEPALQAEAARLAELRLEALEERIDADLALGRHGALVPELSAQVAEAPLRERLRAQQILALYRCGRQAEALEAYGEARRRLVDELGLEPGPALRRLERAVLEQDPALGAPDALPRPPRALPTRQRALALIAAGALALLAAAALVLTRGDGPGARGLAAVAENSVVAIDPHTNRMVAAITVGGTPTSVAAGTDTAWVLNADDQTIARVDRRGNSVRTVGIGATPTDLAAGGGDLWVASGESAYGATGLLRLGADDLRQRTRFELPAQRHQGTPGLPGQVAVGRRAVWAINGSGELARIDVRTGRRTAVATPVEARALTLGTDALWALARDDNTLLRLDPDSGALRSRLSIPATHLDALAAGAGAVWATDSYDGTLWRIDPGPRPTTRTIATGAGTDGIAVGAGAVWTINSLRGTLTRVDPRRNRVAATIDLGGTPRDVDVSADAVWATVAGAQSVAAAAGGAGGPQPLPGPACSRVLTAPGQAPQYLIASDFALRGDQQAANAVAFVLRRHGFRAGRFRLGYQSCDASTADSGWSDPGKCESNAKAYAADPAVIGVVGMSNSACALVEIPILNRAAGGALALISPATSQIGLTHVDPNAPQGALARLYPTGVRNFARVTPADDQEAAAGAVLARELGVHRVYVLDDGLDVSRDEWARPFRRAAPALGVRVVGAASWDPRGIGFRALVERIGHAHADGAYLSGLAGSHGGKLVAALRARLGHSFPLIAPNLFAPTWLVYRQSAGAARGLYVTSTYLPADRLGARGRAFVRDFASTQPGAPVFDSAAYAGAATEVLLAAIARSDGTRAGVVRALAATRLSDGILGPIRFDRNGDWAAPRVVVMRVINGDGDATSFAGAVIDRVIIPPANAIG